MERKCRVCGCTYNNACVTENGPCSWVDEDLCSVCDNRPVRTFKVSRIKRVMNDD